MIARLKRFARLPIVAGVNASAEVGEPDWPRLIRTSDIASSRALTQEVVRVDPVVARGYELEHGDLLMCRSGSLGISLLYEGRTPAAYAGYLVRIRFDRRRAVPRFFGYWAESSLCRNQIRAGAITSTIDNFNAAKIANLEVPAMGLQEQQCVADFLDRECERIAKLVDAVEALSAGTQVALFSAIASRLNDQPQVRLGYRFDVQLGKMLDGSRVDTSNLSPYLRNTNVQWDRVILNDLQEMTFAGDDLVRYALRPGDLLVCEGGEVGRAAVWEGQLPDCYYQKALNRVRARGTDSTRYLMYALRFLSARGTFVADATGSAILHLPAERLRATKVPLPDPVCQNEIVNELDAIAVSTARVVSRIEAVRTRLVEYRDALITEAVTGKLDVARLSDAQLDESARAAAEGEAPEVLAS